MPVERYLVTINRPEGMGVGEMEDYIRDAVLSTRGGMNPDEPIFRAKLEVSVHKQIRRPALQEQQPPRPWGEVALSQLPKKKE